MSGEITNIVPLDPDAVPVEGFVSPAAQTGDEAYGKRMAADAIQFLEAEFSRDTGASFWETLKEGCDKKLKDLKPKGLAQPMDDKQSKAFLKVEIPWGKYAGRSVGSVLKKDRGYLERMAGNPLPFQIQLSKYLLTNPT